MAEVSETLQAVAERISDIMDCVIYICDTLPTTFKLGECYVLAPESVSIEHMISSGSMQEFDIEIIIPTHESKSDRIDTLAKNVIKGLENTNLTLRECFNRTRIIGGACISGVDYSIQNWEVNGYIYASSDVTLHFKSLLPY